MELEFDKEIDSLLRKTDRGVLVGDKPGGKPAVHLDADELAAFAENALPQKTRALHMTHLADCDRCRRILSGLITLNAEAVPVEERIVAPAIIPAAPIEPWYRQLILPNLAYVMGGLVLIFGGLITFSLLQSSMSENATISQSVANTTSARGPMAVADELQSTEMASNSNANSAAANQPMMSANSSNAAVASNTAPSGSTLGQVGEKDAAPADDRGVTLDGVEASKPAAAAPAPMPPPPAKSEANEVVTTIVPDSPREEAKAKMAEKKRDAQAEREDADLAVRQSKDAQRTQAGGLAKATPGPSREARQNFPNRADNTFEMYEERRVSGRTFQRRDNVWYDRAYRGQATVNIRRNTDEYRKLDSGLRTIAESLGGVVVVMWEGKAYRFQ